MATTTTAKPWKAEYAKSSRSSCKTCKTPIDKENLRLGKMVQAPFDGLMPMWNHASCVLKKANQIKSPNDVEGMDALRLEDQQKIQKYVETSVSSSNTGGGYDNEHVEVSRTSRATCRLCNKKIMKGEVRLSVQPEGQDTRGLAWHHTGCFIGSSPSTQVEKLSGWESLSPPDQEIVLSSVRQVSNSGVRSMDNYSISGSKRKSAASGIPKPKSRKSDENISPDDEPTQPTRKKKKNKI